MLSGPSKVTGLIRALDSPPTRVFGDSSRGSRRVGVHAFGSGFPDLNAASLNQSPAFLGGLGKISAPKMDAARLRPCPCAMPGAIHRPSCDHTSGEASRSVWAWKTVALRWRRTSRSTCTRALTTMKNKGVHVQKPGFFLGKTWFLMVCGAPGRVPV